MSRRADLVWTDVSEERIASIFKVHNWRARNQREQVASSLWFLGTEKENETTENHSRKERIHVNVMCKLQGPNICNV
jgi:hypothetical protein